MPYYRFQNDRPRKGETVHCFTTLKALKDFADMMKKQDPDFQQMKFWEIEGNLIRHDEGDVVVHVATANQIHF